MAKQSSFDERKELRQKLILETLAITPLTIREVEEKAHINYVTARRDIVELKEKGLIFIAPNSSGNGAVLYQSRPYRPMPEIFSKQTGNIVSIKDIAKHWKPEYLKDYSQVKSIATVFESVIEMLEVARITKEGNVVGDPVKEKEILKLLAPHRRALQDAIVNLDNFLNLANQLLNMRAWTYDDLVQITEDENFDPHEIRGIWERLEMFRVNESRVNENKVNENNQHKDNRAPTPVPAPADG